jgi:hypothetical protein
MIHDRIPIFKSPDDFLQIVSNTSRHIIWRVYHAAGHIIDLQIVAIYETTAVNGHPLDLLVEAKKTNNDPVKQFGVIFSSSPPDWSAYPMPLLWREDGKAGVGRWR